MPRQYAKFTRKSLLSNYAVLPYRIKGKRPSDETRPRGAVCCGVKLLNSVFQCLAWFEGRDFCGSDLNGFAGVRVAVRAGSAAPKLESAEAGKLHLDVTLKRFDDDLRKSVDGIVGVLLAHTGLF